MKRYVAGFAFDYLRQRVALILKNKGPDVVVGNWNGIGGKVEGNERIVSATEREFLEETGVNISASKWKCFCQVIGLDWEVFFMTTTLDEGDNHNIKTMEIEKVAWMYIDDLPVNIVSNLNWLIPMALDSDILHSTVEVRG